MCDFDRKKRAARESVVEGFFKGTSRSYDRVVAITTLGLDVHWKRRLLAYVPESARSILDLACGTGILTMKLHRRHPKARLVGVDMTEEYLAVAREAFEDIGADVTFLGSNAETMDLEGDFDVVVSSYIPKYVDADELLERLEGHVAPGGIVALHDFDYPHRGLPQAAWKMHMLALRTLGRRLFPAWDVVFNENLRRLVQNSRWAREFESSFARHGYLDVRYEKLSFRTAAIVSARKPG